MTIKRRILIANVLMVGIPVAATLIAMAACALVLWHALSLGQGFDDSSDFREAALAATAATDRALAVEGDAREARLAELDRLLDKLHLGLEVTGPASAASTDPAQAPAVHAHGAASAAPPALARAAASLSDGGMVEQDGHAVTVAALDARGETYRLAIIGTMNTQASYTRLKAIALACAAAVAACVLVSSVIAGRFAQRFLVRRIEGQLDELKGGLRALADGDLAYRIEWAPDAEFARACDDFNLMAERQQGAVARLERQDARRRQLIADISHDLRSPLTSVRGYAEALRDGMAASPERRARYLGVICDKARQMDRLVETLFEFSKLEVDDYPVRLEAVDVEGAARDEAASLAEAHAGTVDIEVAVTGAGATGDGPAPLPRALADRALLGRVIDNLVDNSVKYRRGETASVRISILPGPAGRVLVDVADDGQGVPEADLERIFDPFFRTDAAREHPERGSGMGLAFVRRAVELMGGEVRARGNAPHGLIVEIELPAASAGDNGGGAGGDGGDGAAVPDPAGKGE